MSADHSLDTLLLKLFAEARDHRLSATSLKTKLATAAKKSTLHDPEHVDRAMTALIEAGKVSVTGGGSTGHHPRPKGSYRLTGAGKDHVRPVKPDVSDELCENQEAYILFQFLRIKENDASMSRSDLSGKLKTKAAREKFELDPKDNKDTIDYHVHQLVAAGCLEARRQGVATILTLTELGEKTLGTRRQYDDVSFTLTGAALNKLLDSARESGGDHSARVIATEAAAPTPAASAHHAAASHAADLEPRHIHEFVAQLKADKFAGRDLIPIHEVRALVAQHHGTHAASHPVFDRLLKTMRSEENLKIIAIADSRDTPQQHLDDSIPGLNETLFFIDTE